MKCSKDERYAIIADPTYGYLHVDPLPSREEIEAYYKKEFYSSAYPRFNDSQLDVQLREQEFFESRWEAICSTCREHFGRIEGLSIFDIGFGYAQALLYFKKKGMRPSGLEPAPEGVEYAKKNGLHVYNAEIEDFSCVGSERFDVVTLINVLEHLREPAETLRETCRMNSMIFKPLPTRNSTLAAGGSALRDTSTTSQRQAWPPFCRSVGIVYIVEKLPSRLRYFWQWETFTSAILSWGVRVMRSGSFLSICCESTAKDRN